MESQAAPRSAPARHETSFWVAVACIVIVSMSLAIGFLSTRNLIDDEVGSFDFTPRSVGAIWTAANSSDFHPPGMYVLAHAFYRLTDSERWTTLGGLGTLYLGLLVFGISTIRHFRDKTAALFYCGVLFLHPQIMMWGNTVRWYPYWTGLALIFLTLGLSISAKEDRELPPPSWAACGLLGVLGAALFYLNYITPLFLAAFVVAYAFRHSGRNLLRLLPMGAVFALLVIPQVIPFVTVHLPKRSLQEYTKFAAGGRLLHATVMSETMVPWNLVGLCFLLAVALPLALMGLRKGLRESTGAKRIVQRPAWVAVTVFLVLLFALATASGLGGKPRSFLLLPPLFALLAGIGFAEIPNRAYRAVAIALTICWIAVGSGHLLAREGTAKGGMNDHPEKIAQFIAQKSQGQCAMIILSDPALTYALNNAARQQPWTVVSLYGDPVHKIPSGEVRLKCTPQMEFLIRSYTGDADSIATRLAQRFDAARASMDVTGEEPFYKDTDAALKRRIPGLGESGKTLPDYRVQMSYGIPKASVDWQSLGDQLRWNIPVSVSGLR